MEPLRLRDLDEAEGIAMPPPIKVCTLTQDAVSRVQLYPLLTVNFCRTWNQTTQSRRVRPCCPPQWKRTASLVVIPL